MGGPIRAFIEGSPQAAVSVPAQTSVGAVAGVILSSNAKRKGFWIQNTGTTILYLSLGTTNPTVTAYHVALKGGTGADDGGGASYFESNWVGQVNAIGSAPAGTCVVVEITTGSPDWNQSGDWGIS
jgi:hypothetical protein